MVRRLSPLLPALAILAAFCAPVSADDNTSWIDRYHAAIESDLYGTATWFDRYFEDELYPGADNASSTMRLTNEFRWDEDEGFDYRIKARVRIRLPGLKGKLRLLISGESEGDPNATAPEDPGNPGLSPLATDGRASTELAYDLVRTRNTILFVGAGVRIKIPPTAFVRTRLVHARELGHSVIGRLFLTPFYDARDGLGETTQVDFERPFAVPGLLKWSSFLTLAERDEASRWGTELSYLHMLSPRNGITAGGAVTGPDRPNFHIDNYRAYIRYRRNFHRNWLYYELEPDVNWRKQDDGGYKAAPGITMRLEINFNGKPSAPIPR